MTRTCGTWSAYCGGCRCDGCGTAAREYLDKHRTWYDRSCLDCGREYKTQVKRGKYCSNACQAAYEHGPDRRLKVKPEPKPTRRDVAMATLTRSAAGERGTQVMVAGCCAHCGSAAVARTMAEAGAVFYCSARCRKTVRGKGLHPKIGTATREYVYRRDGYRCHLCRQRVAMTKASPHPRSPVLDHLVPLSLGGASTRDNLRLAHWICNALKSNHAANEQLMLVG